MNQMAGIAHAAEMTSPAPHAMEKTAWTRSGKKLPTGGRPAATRRLLAVASAGGHWQQLQLIRPAFEGMVEYFATTVPDPAKAMPADRIFLIPDCNRNDLRKNFASLVGVLRVIWRVRPHVVVSTGAAPGLIAIMAGRLIGARTVWIDSIANAAHLSLSGRIAGYVANLQLTQSKPLSETTRARYFGSLL